jgi:pyrrolidone-carboxylate peptidase
VQEEFAPMSSYVLYFLIGGTVVTTVAYIGTHADGMTAAFVAGLPVLFIINVLLLYHTGGVSAGVSYARGALICTPVFVVYGIFLLVRRKSGREVLSSGTVPLGVQVVTGLISEQVVPDKKAGHEEHRS